MTTGMTGGYFVLSELCKHRTTTTEGLDAAKLFGGGSGHGRFGVSIAAEMVMVRAQHRGAARG